MIKTKLPVYQLDNEVVLALTLNKENKTERVLVGTESDIRIRLEGKDATCVWYDQERPMGTLLLEYDSQDREWWCGEVLAPYCDALRYPRERKKNECQGWGNLEEKLTSNNAISVFVACCTLSLYYSGKNERKNADRADVFGQKMLTLVRHFRMKVLDEEDLCLEKMLELLVKACGERMYRDETGLRLWYPWRECKQECAITEASLLPLVRYYLHRLDDWGLCFRSCEVCRKIFLAESEHYCLCSEACEKEQNRRNKRAYDARNKGNLVEQIYQQKRDRIRKIINQLKQREGVTEDSVNSVEMQYRVFRNEAKIRKGKTITKDAKDEFLAWLYDQEKYFEGLEGEYR